MNLQERKEILVRLGKSILSPEEDLEAAVRRASQENGWFTTEFIELSLTNIATQYLSEESLQTLIDHYGIPEENESPKKVGIVMAGNIPAVGFHDLLCTFLAGHYAHCKLSSKDSVLIKFMVKKMVEWAPAAEPYFVFAEMLKGCDAYIATGSNNSSQYFTHYFSKYPHIIRRNRTSVALLTGDEKTEELEKLADDVYQFFGLGCRNVTQVYVPQGYNFEPLLRAFDKYNHLADHQKYKNNYDYNLAILLLNNRYYMSNKSLLLVEEPSPFSPISQLNYQFYTDADEVKKTLAGNDNIQCIVSRETTRFGEAQCPGICDFADGVDTMQFLVNLNKEHEVRKP
ncbi:acyl-CoA reductase [Flavisolibacter sp. BT320]|nr:acyl-CoA reductase [Flavisolibacter longurius]